MLSNKSYTTLISNKIIDRLGGLSLVIYIVHLPFGYFIRELNLSKDQKQILFIASSVTVSIILYTIVENCKKHIHLKKLENIKL